MQNRIEKVISEEIIHKEKLEERLDRIVNRVSEHLEPIINEAIIRYVIENIFVKQENVANIARDMLEGHINSFHWR